MKNIFVATPTHDGKFFHTYLQSTFQYCSSRDIGFYFNYMAGDSLISRARSALLSIFYENIEKLNLTHLLWLDSDVYLPLDGLQKMIDRDVDVISAAIPTKEPPSPFGIKISSGGIFEKVEPFLYKGTYAATGALLIKTEAVLKAIKFAEENNQTFLNSPEDPTLMYDIFRVGLNKNGTFISEDIYFCSILYNLGYPIYIDTSFYVEHCDNFKYIWKRGPMEINPGIIENGSPTLLNEDEIDKYCVSSILWNYTL